MSKNFWLDLKNFLEKICLNNNDDELKCLLCGICGHIMVNAAQIICGCRFCYLCIEDYFLNGGRICPRGDNADCRLVSLSETSDIHKEKKSNERILSIVVQCPNEGCLCEGDIGSMVGHYAGCMKGSIWVKDAHLYNDTEARSETVNRTEDCINTETITTKGKTKTVNSIKSNESDTLEDLRVLIDSLRRKNRKLERTVTEMNDRIKNLEESQSIEFELLDSITRLEERIEKSEIKPFVWVIEKFNKRTIKYDQLYSLPFSIFKNGYKMRILLYPNGAYNYLFLSVYFEIIQSEYDLLLEWPFCYNVTFTLLNQNGGSNHSRTMYYVHHKHRQYVYGRPTTFKNVGLGDSEFIEYSRIADSETFLKNDTIVLTCSVSKSPIYLAWKD